MNRRHFIGLFATAAAIGYVATTRNLADGLLPPSDPVVPADVPDVSVSDTAAKAVLPDVAVTDEDISSEILADEMVTDNQFNGFNPVTRLPSDKFVPPEEDKQTPVISADNSPSLNQTINRSLKGDRYSPSKVIKPVEEVEVAPKPLEAPVKLPDMELPDISDIPIPKFRPEDVEKLQQRMSKPRVAEEKPRTRRENKVAKEEPQQEKKKPSFSLPSLFRPAARSITIYNTHNDEKFVLDPRNVDKAAWNWFMRDFRENESIRMAAELAPRFARVATMVEADTWELISGFRTRKTNTMLQGTKGGQASNSLHITGLAMDTRARGKSLSNVYKAALAVARAENVGGVGYYPNPASNFVHMDVGRMRSW